MIVIQFGTCWQICWGWLTKLPRVAFPDTVLHISASNDHLLTIADLMQMKKMDNEGHIRPYW